AGRSLVPLGALGVTVTAGDTPAPPADGTAPGLARLIADRGDDPASPAAALATFDDVARVVSEVALACFGLGFMPDPHGQQAGRWCGPTASRRTGCGAAWPTSSGPPGPASTSRRRRPS